MTVRSLGAMLFAVAVVTATGLAQTKPAPASVTPADIAGLWASEGGLYGLYLEPPEHLVSQGAPKFGALRGRNTIVLDPTTGIIPYQPWALERRNRAMAEFLLPSAAMMDPAGRAWPNGVPRLNYYNTCGDFAGLSAGPIHIMPSATKVAFFYEAQHEFRMIPINGRPHPGQDIKLWMGASRGRWEGNTFVVDVRNANDVTRFNAIGDFHSDQMRLTERWTLIDKNTLQYRATIDDPKVFTQPWTIGITQKRCKPGTEILEFAGVEGEFQSKQVEEIRLKKGLPK